MQGLQLWVAWKAYCSPFTMDGLGARGTSSTQLSGHGCGVLSLVTVWPPSAGGLAHEILIRSSQPSTSAPETKTPDETGYGTIIVADLYEEGLLVVEVPAEHKKGTWHRVSLWIPYLLQL